MNEKNFLTAADVAKFMSISVPTAYKIIRQMNEELRAKGYITISGKISRVYFEERTYGSVVQI